MQELRSCICDELDYRGGVTDRLIRIAGAIVLAGLTTRMGIGMASGDVMTR